MKDEKEQCNNSLIYILFVFRIFRSPYIVEYTYDVGK